ncbi:MAG: hypothetical protein DRP64_01380 [Verrucomicrobia bacterium]|nr:MAG: hypothetical protein DRP64_01380 [Verrucomicrobiota bacterium]
MGSNALNVRIDVDLQRIAEAVAPCSLAGVLLGGYGRGEGTPFINPNGSQCPFNDYDLVVVVNRLNGKVRKKFQTLEKQLSAELGLPVDLCPYQLSHLRRCEFSLLNYEMKHGHKVVWGDANILAAMPDYPHNAIPLSEGSRLLLNRGKLLLDIQQRLASPEQLSEEERIRFIKFIFKVRLAFGDCTLLTAGQYDIYYTTKKTRIPNIGTCPDRDAVIEGDLEAMELKEWGDFHSLESFDIAAEFEATRMLFLRFLPWYRSQVPSRKQTIPSWMRERLYTALMKLLQGRPSLPAQLFYKLQRRFS